MRTSSTIPDDGSNPTRWHNSLTAATPRSTEEREESEPMNRPMGVLATPQMTALFFAMILPF